MKKSDQVNELFAAMAKAQGKVKGASMDKVNPHFKSKYADLASIWDACRAALSENGLTVIQTIGEIEGQMYLTTLLGHTSGQWIESTMPMILSKKDSHGMGSAATYAKRYALSALVGVCGDEDDDGNEAVKTQTNGNNGKKAEDAKNELKKLVDSYGDDRENFQTYVDWAFANNSGLSSAEFLRRFQPSWYEAWKKEKNPQL